MIPYASVAEVVRQIYIFNYIPRREQTSLNEYITWIINDGRFVLSNNIIIKELLIYKIEERTGYKFPDDKSLPCE